MTYRTLALTIYNCRHSDAPCAVNARERQILESIAANLPAEFAAIDQIEFRSEAEEPGFFLLDGNVRVAKTFEEVGAKIYFNLDLIYQRDGIDSFRPIGVDSALAMLIHELGHHVLVDNTHPTHQELDALGARVRTANFDRLFAIKAPGWGVATHWLPTFVAVNAHHLPIETSRVFVIDSFATYELTNETQEAPTCRVLPGANPFVQTFSLFSPAWTGASTVRGFGDLICTCAQLDCLRVIDSNYRFTYAFDFVRLGAGIRLARTSWIEAVAVTDL